MRTVWDVSRFDINHMTNYISLMIKNVNTGARVQAALAGAGRSLKSLSDETGIPYSTLIRKAKGQREFSFSELLAIAEALGVHPAALTPEPFRSAA